MVYKSKIKEKEMSKKTSDIIKRFDKKYTDLCKEKTDPRQVENEYDELEKEFFAPVVESMTELKQHLAHKEDVDLLYISISDTRVEIDFHPDIKFTMYFHQRIVTRFFRKQTITNTYHVNSRDKRESDPLKYLENKTFEHAEDATNFIVDRVAEELAKRDAKQIDLWESF